MKINNLKDLDKLIQLCRKRGVTDITIDGITLTLGMEPVKENTKQEVFEIEQQTYTPGGITENTKIQIPKELTDAELLFWSSRAEEDNSSQPSEV
jgi:CO dehydrogenase/acetyl-CoA synthase gamma subunit (corrinoid Fe-S protein)